MAMDIPETDLWSATAPGTGGDWQAATRPDGQPVSTPRTHATTVLHARTEHASHRNAPLQLTETDRLQRTQVIRRTTYGFTERDIIQTMAKQTGIPGDRLFESVSGDPRDNRRFYMTYTTMNVKHDVMHKGFYLGGIHIRPTDDVIEGYLPNPPFYSDKSTLDALLSRYRNVTKGDFVRTDDGVRIAGYKFRLRLGFNKTLPATLTYNGLTWTSDGTMTHANVTTVNATDTPLDDAGLAWLPRSLRLRARRLPTNSTNDSSTNSRWMPWTCKKRTRAYRRKNFNLNVQYFRFWSFEHLALIQLVTSSIVLATTTATTAPPTVVP